MLSSNAPSFFRNSRGARVVISTCMYVCVWVYALLSNFSPLYAIAVQAGEGRAVRGFSLTACPKIKDERKRENQKGGRVVKK